ncbi:conserved hypothetical protein [Neospora caninum Liverpool]|uniref:Uncharacterized protein n=1 Tax=Neospora caninum (strain Liverpool) TaxID=572307 RepID=F0VLE1_NEOCL|nr:conserved hypothetical protein [Neospora caninum Liverpool]CBZ54069.1 conserved hypothetical protein [Neospora caninum Liverpool]CEL68765.1 TPA: hypothetical protein BN1204_045030 [Neospora caninum Liverpool]|eukprot:XP_003884100.1 conserved hypothetical protein [Neospora caninum Liverpool]
MDIPTFLPLLAKGRKLVEDFHWDRREADLRQAITTIANRLGELHREDAQLRQKKFINEERRKRRMLVTDSSFPCSLKEGTPEAVLDQGASHGVKPLPSNRSYCPSTLSRGSFDAPESASRSSRSRVTNFCEPPASLASRSSLRYASDKASMITKPKRLRLCQVESKSL